MNVRMSLVAFAAMLSFGAQAQATATTSTTATSTASAPTMTKEQVKAEHERIEAAAKSDKAACKQMKDNAKDICEAEAKAKEKVAKAELKYKETGSARDQEKLAKMRAEADYEVAKEKCEDQPKDQVSACKKEAKAAEKSAMAAAKKS